MVLAGGAARAQDGAAAADRAAAAADGRRREDHRLEGSGLSGLFDSLDQKRAQAQKGVEGGAQKATKAKTTATQKEKRAEKVKEKRAGKVRRIAKRSERGSRGLPPFTLAHNPRPVFYLHFSYFSKARIS